MKPLFRVKAGKNKSIISYVPPVVKKEGINDKVKDYCNRKLKNYKEYHFTWNSLTKLENKYNRR